MHGPRVSVPGRAARAWTLAAVFSVVTTGVLAGNSSPRVQDAETPPAGVERPWVEVTAQPFGNEIRSATFTHFLEGDLLVTGSVHTGPAVVVEQSSEFHATGDRVIPVSYFSLVLRDGSFISQADGMYYRAAASSEPFQLLTAHREVSAKVLIRPLGKRTWEEVLHEDDLLITVTGAVLPSGK